jgi:hypothetical protein
MPLQSINDALAVKSWSLPFDGLPFPDGEIDSLEDRLQLLGYPRQPFDSPIPGPGGLVHREDPDDLDQSNLEDDLYLEYGIDLRHRCYRIGVRKENALGIAEIGGDQWLHPELGSESISVFDPAHRKFDVMFDEDTGLPFTLMTKDGPDGSGVEKLYVDGYVDTYESGAEIPWLIRFKEYMGAAEHMLIKFAEFHAFLRPQDEKKKNAPGYTKLGQRNAQEVSLNVYRNGNLIRDARTHGFPLKGDLVFDEQIEANRIQMELTGTASEIRITGAKSYYEQLDQRGNPSLRIMEEGDFQEMISMPTFWVTRGRAPIKDRVTGNEGVGSVSTMVEGPDGDSESAMRFLFDESMEWDEDYSLSGNFTLMFSLKNAASDLSIIQFADGTLIKMDMPATTQMLSIEKGMDHREIVLPWSGADWGMFMLQRDGSELKVYFNGAYLGVVSLYAVDDLSGKITFPMGEDRIIFDVRIYSEVVNENAWYYYLDNVINQNGGAVLPI